MNEPHELVFFTDRDLGRQFPALLRAAGVRLERHDDHFGADTPDEEWIGEIGRRGWIAVSRDARIRYSPLALSVLMESGTQLFVLVGKLTTAEAAETFLKWRERIVETVVSEREPFIAKIRRDGVFIWLRRKDWRGGRR
jgi:PIN domain-containing protein